MKPDTQARIDNLLAESDTDTDTIPQDVLAAANTEFKAQKDAEQKERIVRHLKIAATATENAVELLRTARKQERRAKAFLFAIAGAEDNYKVNGNWKEYSKANDAALEAYHGN